MNFKKAFLTFLSVVISVTPCYSNAMKESSCGESSPLTDKSEKIENCPICLEKMDPEKDFLTSSGCSANVSHTFHTKCWNDYFPYKNGEQYERLSFYEVIIKKLRERLVGPKVPCPVCKRETGKIVCAICNGEMRNRGQNIQEDAIFYHLCGHNAHWACVNKLVALLDSYGIYRLRGTCPSCNVSGEYSMTTSDGSSIFDVTRQAINERGPVLSKEQLKKAAVNLYPELKDKLNEGIFSWLFSSCC